MNDVYIYDAVRTPRGKGRAPKDGKPGGALSSVAPHELVAGLSHVLHKRNSAIEGHVSQLTLGCVGQVGAQGGHIALVSRLAAGLPDTTAVSTINNYCVSGLTAVNQSAAWAQSKPDALIMAGGVECLSQVGFLADKAKYYTDPALAKQLKWVPPVLGAELIASLEGFTKSNLDEITLMSHQRAETAWQNGHYQHSVSPVEKDGEVLLEKDELIRGNMTLEQLEAMAPAFAEQGASGFDAIMLAEYPELDEITHIHSIANCPGMVDGAALVLLGGSEAGKKAQLTPKAKIIAFAEITGDPVLQFGAGFTAIEQVMKETGLSIGDFDRIECMEAFAATPLKFYRDYKPDMDKVNVNGGHLAMGHPMGATGAVLLTGLVHELERCDGKLGLVVAFAGGGIASATIIERY